ncbi:MAG: tetratricopeptide repeat protein [Candidatus Omnitrophica bacterium]|nr:tetratricopeptide repeat protein [Candidatus Omnitrophota bacterium]
MTKKEAMEASLKDPLSLENKYILGLVYLNLRKDKEAQEIFSSLLADNPAMTEAKWGMAEALRRQHDVIESKKLLDKILKASPGFAPALITLAYIRYTEMDFEAAVKLAGKVLEGEPGETDLSNRVRAYLMMGGAKGMIAHYGGPLSKIVNGTAVFPNLKKAERLQPESAPVLFGLGSFYFLAPALAGGDLDRAQDYLEKAVNADPLFADAYVRLGQLYKIQGDIKKYAEYLEKALEIDPQNELARDIKSGRCKFICKGKD